MASSVREGGPSRTAAGVAYRRAVHQVLDRPPVFRDPIARALLGPEMQARLDRDPGEDNRSPFATYLRAFLAVRSRVAEDTVESAVAAGVKQYVVLGAGFDTFAYRNPFPELRVFEADHPRTQAWKRKRLEAAGVSASAMTTYVPVDFETDDAARALTTAGFNERASAVVSWLGVAPYLEERTVWTTLAWVSRAIGDRGSVVFDYGARPAWWKIGQRLAWRRLASRVAAAGEPIRTVLRPADVSRRLSALGYGQVADLDGSEINRRYFSGRTDGLRVGGAAHVVIASRA
jgi:methyltransferase (TIGR00027 family)